MFPTEFSPKDKDKNLFSTLVKPKDLNQESASKITGRWTKEEHKRFVEGLKKFGKNWKKVEEYVGTRSGPQVRSHAQKFFLKLEREMGIGGLNPSDLLNMEGTPERTRKASDCSNSTNCSYQENLMDPTNNIKRRLELNRKLEESRTMAALLENFPLHTYMPLLDQLCTINTMNTQLKQRRMSMDSFPSQSYSSNPLLENLVTRPQMRPPPINPLNISQILQMTSAPRLSLNSFPMQPMNFAMDQVLLNNTINASFCINNTTNLVVKPRKFSEDNVLTHNNLNPLLTQFTPSHKLDDLELLVKRVKKF